ncbi:MAG TPA: phosphatase PAP2 family protein, partial [Verrucomicrobiae bacterium]|nr:phosphatase PAP2 family protein [Verrucomicrobiae bacterium]
MTWIESLDVALFRFINQLLWNPVFDRVMPFLSHNKFFMPALPVVAAFVIWRWRRRGVLCVFFLMAVVFLGDPLVVNTIKKSVARPRPFNALAGVRVPEAVGKTDTFAMPSSHASSWFAMTLVAFVYFRRSGRVMLPLACAVGFSRV